MSAWIYLTLAIVLEVAGTISMKLSDGFTKLTPSIALGIFYILSITALTFALKKIDVSMAYAIWAGIGTALISIIGILYFKEPMNLLKVVGVVFIIVGVVALHLSSGEKLS